jgi:hypothetical protein
MQNLDIAIMKLKALAFEFKFLSNLLEEIEQFNGPKFIRVFLLWRKCLTANVSPFITRGELRKHLEYVNEKMRLANRDALMLYYDTH